MIHANMNRLLLFWFLPNVNRRFWRHTLSIVPSAPMDFVCTTTDDRNERQFIYDIFVVLLFISFNRCANTHTRTHHTHTHTRNHAIHTTCKLISPVPLPPNSTNADCGVYTSPHPWTIIIIIMVVGQWSWSSFWCHQATPRLRYRWKFKKHSRNWNEISCWKCEWNGKSLEMQKHWGRP